MGSPDFQGCPSEGYPVKTVFVIQGGLRNSPDTLSAGIHNLEPGFAMLEIDFAMMYIIVTIINRSQG